MTDGHPIGFKCECGNHIEFPKIVHRYWDKTFEAACKKCKRIWRGSRGEMRLVGRANPRLDLWTPKGRA